MPNAPKTPQRPIRVDDDLWSRFGDVAQPDRSSVLRDFIRWFVREPGAKMPRRPDVQDQREQPGNRPG